MLKKLSLILLLASPCYAVMDDFLGPNTSANANISIVSPGAGKRNCLDFVLFFATQSTAVGGQATYQILDGGATTYSLAISTAVTTPVINQFDTPLAWCGSLNKATTISVSNSTGYQINYIGFVDRVSP